MFEKMRKYYLRKYPSDKTGAEMIDSTATFNDLFDRLDAHQDIYPVCGYDSVVRERLFQRLAALIHKPRNYVYDQWLLY